MSETGRLDVKAIVDWKPGTPAALRRWLRSFMGVRIARAKVCPEHDTPWDFFEEMYFRRPSLALVLGSRGAGKSFLSALDTHLASRWNAKHGTRVMGGSKSQSDQVYRALRETVWEG